MSILQLQNNSRILDRNAKQLFASVMQEYHQGKIKSDVELYYRIYSTLRDFYIKLGQPTMEKRYAWGPPFSDDYNQTLLEVAADFSTIFLECDALTNSITNGFEQMEVNRQILVNRVRRLEDRLKMLSLSFNSQPSETLFRDSFIDHQFYEQEMVEETPANINAREGVLTLAKIDGEEYLNDIKISILPSSNGYPGNTHQVSVIGGNLKFTGEENAHLNLLDMVDGNADSWFEYEIYSVSDKTYEEIAGLGLEYHEGVSWVKNDEDPLCLHLTIELPTYKTLNWLSISPFIASDKGSMAAEIKAIIIDDGKGHRQSVNDGVELFNEERVYLFSRQKCKYIHVYLEQHTPYETWAGHFCFREAQGISLNFFERDRVGKGQRLDGPNPSVQTLGLKVDPNNKQLLQPTTDQSYQPPGSLEVIKELFTVPEDNSSYQASLEAIPASRYHIGVKDIIAANYRFEVESTYVSKTFTTLSPIESIQLQVKDQIPFEFPEGSWIDYYISINDGETWLPITPINHKIDGGKLEYLVNSSTPAELRRDDVGYIETLEGIHEVRVKIDLHRPTHIVDADYYSPIVYEYTLVVTEAEEGNV